MADNALLNTNTGAAGATNIIVAADDVGGVLTERVKVTFGPDGVATRVSVDDPLPIAQTGALPAGANNIGSVVVASLPALPAGANNIGKAGVLIAGVDATAGAGTVGAGTQRTTLATDDPAVSALVSIRDATNTINVAQDSDVIKQGAANVTPKFAVISASSSGNNTLVAAVTSKKIRVLAYNLIGNGAVNVKFQSGAGGTDKTGLKYIAAAGGGICAPFSPAGWFETAANTLLNLNLSGAVAVGGELVYIEAT
jgi:hypothetical protein